jgi:hypothetical protein
MSHSGAVYSSHIQGSDFVRGEGRSRYVEKFMLYEAGLGLATF